MCPFHCSRLFRRKYWNVRPRKTREPLLLDSQCARVEGMLERPGAISEVPSRRILYESPLKETVRTLELLVQRGSYVSDTLFYRILKRCIAENNLVLGRSVHSLALRSGFASNTLVANNIIRMYSYHGRLQEATQVFATVATPDTFMWVSIISALVGSPCST
eukprot:TRINITY_DN3614_c0_g1_i1.p1 TRINITY_DN3614_c0_g1~~TRINITY_DN3614_c0_g1_i1.p1  ORF type:complete len:162 (-),score=5.36 TRINITY_DN3614_c0_g1_i1:4-489(-)